MSTHAPRQTITPRHSTFSIYFIWHRGMENGGRTKDGRLTSVSIVLAVCICVTAAALEVVDSTSENP